MEMTFDQYIQNPMGVANSVMSNREMYRNMYMMKLDSIMVSLYQSTIRSGREILL